MPTDWKLTYGRRTRELDLQPQSPAVTEVPAQPSEAGAMPVRTLKGYEKTDGTLSYSIVCVISGGERKEKDFLRETDPPKGTPFAENARNGSVSHRHNEPYCQRIQ